MSSIFNVFDPSRAAPLASPKGHRADDADAESRTSGFSGALEHAERQREFERKRNERDDDAIIQLDVLAAQDRLDRSGVRERGTARGGVPHRTADGPPEAIRVHESPAHRDATSATRRLETGRADTEAHDGIVRGPVERNPSGRRFKTAPLGAPPDPEARAATRPAIPPPPIPGSAARRQTMRQTLSYAFRSPPGGRTEITTTSAIPGIEPTATHTRATPPPRRTSTEQSEVAPDMEITRVWSRPAVDAVLDLPPAPPWSGSTADEPPIVRVPPPPVIPPPVRPRTTPPPIPVQSADAAAAGAAGAQRKDNAIVSGPLRAYAAAMAGVAPSASALGPAAPTDEVLQTTPPIPTAAIAALLGGADGTVGEPISAGLDLPASALEQLSPTGVPMQPGLDIRASVHGRVFVDRFTEAAANEAPPPGATLGRAGPQRAEVFIGAGDDKIGLAITTAGPHVMVEAHVANPAMADAMRSELEDLRSALERHDLELSDLTFGEASQQKGSQSRPEGGRGTGTASDSAAPDETTAQSSATPGIRIVA